MEFIKDYLEQEMLKEYSKITVDFLRSMGLSDHLDNAGINCDKIYGMTYIMDLGIGLGYIYIPNANSIAYHALSKLSEIKFGNNFTCHHKTDKFSVAHIAIDELMFLDDKIATKILIHETWHLLEYLVIGYDLLGEGTATHIELKYLNEKVDGLKIKNSLSSDIDAIEKFNIILYDVATSKVQKSNAPPSAFLENKNLRNKLIDELVKEFDANFTRQEVADLIIQKNWKIRGQLGTNSTKMSEKKIINALKQKCPKVVEKFEKYGIPPEIMKSLREFL